MFEGVVTYIYLDYSRLSIPLRTVRHSQSIGSGEKFCERISVNIKSILPKSISVVYIGSLSLSRESVSLSYILRIHTYPVPQQ